MSIKSNKGNNNPENAKKNFVKPLKYDKSMSLHGIVIISVILAMAIPSWAKPIFGIYQKIFVGLFQLAKQLLNASFKLLGGIFKLIGYLLQNLLNGIGVFLKESIKILGAILEGLSKLLIEILKGLFAFLKAFLKALKSRISKLSKR